MVTRIDERDANWEHELKRCAQRALIVSLCLLAAGMAYFGALYLIAH